MLLQYLQKSFMKNLKIYN